MAKIYILHDKFSSVDKEKLARQYFLVMEFKYRSLLTD